MTSSFPFCSVWITEVGCCRSATPINIPPSLTLQPRRRMDGKNVDFSWRGAGSRCSSRATSCPFLKWDEGHRWGRKRPRAHRLLSLEPDQSQWADMRPTAETELWPFPVVTNGCSVALYLLGRSVSPISKDLWVRELEAPVAYVTPHCSVHYENKVNPTFAFGNRVDKLLII